MQQNYIVALIFHINAAYLEGTTVFKAFSLLLSMANAEDKELIEDKEEDLEDDATSMSTTGSVANNSCGNLSRRDK